MFGQVTQTAGGTWFWYKNAATYLLGAHTRKLGQGSITVFWKGRAAISRLRQFSVDAAPDALREPGDPKILTWVMTDEGRKRVDSWPFPSQLGRHLQLVRFECRRQSGSQEEAGVDPFITWARLDEPTADETESIGVYFDPDILPSLSNNLAELVSATADAHPAASEVHEILNHLSSDLSEKAKARS